MNIEVIFGQVLRRIREKNKFSQEELAHLAGLDRTYISLLERGKRRPTINTIFSLSKPLKTSGSDLLKLVEEELKENPL